MKNFIISSLFFAFSFLLTNCADDKPFLSGHIRRASTGLMTPCNPYAGEQTHTCVVYSAAFRSNLLIYNASAEEMVLGNALFPLKVKVGPTTNELAQVHSDKPKFPYILAMDSTTKSLYPVRVFPNNDEADPDKRKSFRDPQPQATPNQSYKFAAIESQDKVIVILTNHPSETAPGGSIDIMALKKKDGSIDTSISKRQIKLGTRPSHIAIDRASQRVLISDEGEENIHVLDLKDILNNLANDTVPAPTTISIGMNTDRIFLSRRNLGLGGEHLYLAALEAKGRKLALLDIDSGERAEIALKEPPLAGYFPDKYSAPCCGGKEPHWIEIATLKGKIIYFSIGRNGGVLSLKESESIDLVDDKTFGISSIHIRTIVGGKVEEDQSLDRETTCNGRKVFLVSSYARQNDIEVEAQSYSCEGAKTVRRLGSEPK